MEVEDGMTAIISSLESAGRIYRVRGGELETRCFSCGDSRKSQSHMHFFMSMTYPHPCYCQRCGFGSDCVTPEIIAGMGVTDRDASVYVRKVTKTARRGKRGRRGDAPETLRLAASQLVIPPPNRGDPVDDELLTYLEGRLGGEPLSPEEIRRYKIVTCGLFGFLKANGIEDMTVYGDQAQYINDRCLGFLSADESYVVFRTIDAGHDWRYRNYRMYREWEGSKMFVARGDVDLAIDKHTVVLSEGIIDLIQIERLFYRDERWEPHFVGMASNGTAHAASIARLPPLGILTIDADVYIDDEPGRQTKAMDIVSMNPFFVKGLQLQVWRNGRPGEKDFGVSPDRIDRVLAHKHRRGAIVPAKHSPIRKGRY